MELAVDWGSPFAPSPEGSPDRDAALQRLSLLSMMLTKGLTFGEGLENGLLPDRVGQRVNGLEDGWVRGWVKTCVCGRNVRGRFRERVNALRERGLLTRCVG